MKLMLRLEGGLQVRCGAKEDGDEGPCMERDFELIKNSDGTTEVKCVTCGERHTLAEVLAAKEDE